MNEFQRIRVLVSDTAAAERVSADAFEAGASGLEERERERASPRSAERIGESADDMPRELWIYAPAARARAVEAMLAELEASDLRGRLRGLGAEQAPDEDWSRRWRDGLGVVRISPRLSVRPPFVSDDGQGGASIVVDPGQAFGTGGHASTRLALTLLDALPESTLRDARVLDVGTGSGVLALAAVALGARVAIGLDVDQVAVREARRNAIENGVADRAAFFAGSVDGLRAGAFDLALANLLRTEVLPLLPALADALAPGARTVFSGLLTSERGEMEAALASAGLAVERTCSEPDPSGDEWLGLVTRRGPRRARRRAARGA